MVVSSDASPATHLNVSPQTLFLWVAAHSKKVQAARIEPQIAQAKVLQADAAFDPTLFSDNRFDSTNDPVESTLTTGGPPRLEDQIFGSDTGLRGQNRRGTSYTLGQKLRFKDSNSTFFSPSQQATSRLRIGITKPLLRGRLTDVNRTLLLTAKFDTQTAQTEFSLTLQEHLFGTVRAYWTLYYEHASKLQRERHLQRAREIANVLQQRTSFDSAKSQVFRVRAAVKNREAELAKVQARIKNAESQLRALVNAPELINQRDRALIPMRSPNVYQIELDIEAEVAEAHLARPEIRELQAEIGAVNARLRLARDQLKPTLNVVGEAYIAGLEGNNDIGDAWVDQFKEGSPGFAAGLVYERPIGNRAAGGATRQRKFELVRMQYLLEETTERMFARKLKRRSAMFRQLSWQRSDEKNPSLRSMKKSSI